MGVRFPFLCFQPRRIDFGVGLAAPSKFAMIFGFVEAVAFDALRPLNSTQEHCMTSFPTIFTLWNARIHVGTSNGSNILSNIEASVD